MCSLLLFACLLLKRDLSLVPGAQPAAWAATVLAIPTPKSQAYFYIGLFMWVLGLGLRPSACPVGSLPTELPSCPVTRLLTKRFKVWFCFYCSHCVSRNYCTVISHFTFGSNHYGSTINIFFFLSGSGRSLILFTFIVSKDPIVTKFDTCCYPHPCDE